MYNYSPIKEIQIKNFRNLGEVTLDFNDSPIITLVGENEAGKTSCVKAFGVCAMHQNARGQKDYIRDGSNGFGVAIILEDGTQVIRMKTATKHVYQVIHPDGTKWTADKLDNNVPQAVQDVMGLIEEPETKELLQIRTYEDQLLFVVTPSSTNYKVMYDALKISNLTRAIKIGSKEANELKAEINNSEANIEAFRKSIGAIKIHDIEPLKNLREHVKECRANLSLMEKAMELKESIAKSKQELGALALLDSEHIETIDETEAMSLASVSRLIKNIYEAKNELAKYSEISTIETVDESMLNKVNEAYNRKQSITDMQSKNRAYIELASVESIDEFTLSKLEDVKVIITKIQDDLGRLKVYKDNSLTELDDNTIANLNSMNTVITYKENIARGTKSIKECTDYIDQVIAWMKSVGVATTDCPRCGESVIIDLDLLNRTEG